MIANRLRWLVVLGGLLSAMFAWHFWTSGVPPLWSFVAPRAETVVTHAALTDATSAGGRPTQMAHISVAWPPGTATEVEVPGLWSLHQRWHLHVAAEVVRNHPVGSALRVRVVDGHPVADRLDLHDLAYALLTTLFALVLTIGGASMLVESRRRRNEPAEEPVQ